MLKNKVIGTFVAVWFAVCLSYGGIRAMLTTALGRSVASAQELTSSLEEDATSQLVVVFDSERSAEAEPRQVDEGETSYSTDTTTEVSSADDAEETEVEAVVEPAEESVDVPAEEETVAEDYEEEDSWYEEDGYEEDVEYEEGPSEEEAEEVYVPSLEEYLSQYTCGSCRRNCSLANPRCFNGSQLADAKAQEYYSMFS